MINKFENRKTNRSSLTNTLRGITNEEKLNNLWLKMQITLNSIFDSSLDNRSGARVAKDVHPGGNFVEFEDGTIRRLLPNNLSQRTACYRHLRTGDYVLVNHQPTLHRPSIQAHMARV
ncbi:unnamed protein product [Rotaria sordida]|uniref:RNA polymerase alpha subunit domain-containing protein n=1 Tax=Rotaria sordida TaxID=392033 RepID=A0A815Q9B0_9BILA|nr:unnamed protein product [Rotaria sordida]